jgi:transposase-like protein
VVRRRAWLGWTLSKGKFGRDMSIFANAYRNDIVILERWKICSRHMMRHMGIRKTKRKKYKYS